MSRAIAGRHRLWLLSVALPMWFSQGCLYVPHWFRGAPIEFRVVDDTTGAPLSNVVVTANWQLVRLNVAHPVEDGQLVILETVSDTDGRVRFSGWGPRLVRPLTTIGMNDPHLVLFKEGYQPDAVHNAFGDYTTNFTRHSDWHGETLRLKRPHDDQSYAQSLDWLGVPGITSGYNLNTHARLAQQAVLGSRLTSDPKTASTIQRCALAATTAGSAPMTVPRLTRA